MLMRLLERAVDWLLSKLATNRPTVAGYLYGAPTSGDTGLWRSRFVLPALFVVGIVVVLARVSNWDVLWAEDGPVFFAGATSPQPLLSIIEPYSGYIHVVPRLTALLLAGTVPVGSMAIAYTVAAAILTAALACFVYAVSRNRIRSRTISLILWFEFVSVSLAGGEVVGSLANLHWYFTAAAIWALLSRRLPRALDVVSTIVVVAAILSDGLCLLLLPLIIARLVLLEEPRRLGFARAVVVAYLIQGISIVVAPFLGSRRTISGHISTPIHMLHLYIDRVVLGGTLGVRGTVSLLGTFDFAWIIAGLMFVGLAVLIGLRGRGRTITFVALGYSLLVFVVCWLPMSSGFDPASLGTGDRYSVVPIIMLSAFAAFALDGWIPRMARRSGVRLLTAAWAVILLALFVIDFHVWDVRSNTEAFSKAVAHAESFCRTDAPQAAVDLPVAPGWGVSLTCDQIVHGVWR
jgi:hypothetical protein